MTQRSLFPDKEPKEPIDADKRIFLHLWLSGTHHTSAFFVYKGHRTLGLGIRHHTCTLFLKRLQKAGVLICSTHESESVRQAFEIDIGIKTNQASESAVETKPIDGTIEIHFLNVVNKFACYYSVEYKGEEVCRGTYDRWAANPVPMMKRLKRMGIVFRRSKEAREMHDEFGYNFEDLFKVKK